MSGPSLAGAIFVAQQESMRELVGDDAYERALGTLPPEVREEVRAASAISWVPFTVVEATMVAVANEAGRGLESFQRELSQKVIKRTINGIWRALMRFTSPETLLARMGVLWSKSYDRGRLISVRFDRDIGAELELVDFPDATDFVLRGIGYGIETLVSHAGGRAVHARWRRTPDGASYTIKWRRA
jgi:hypothetical protein